MILENEVARSLSDKTVLVYDFGNQISVAERLGRDFGRCLYFVPGVINGFKDHKAMDIGRNVPNVQRIDDWWPYFYEIDIFVFTDIYENGLQEWLRSQGRAVFGSGMAGLLESERVQFLEMVSDLKLPTLTYDVAYGVYDLEEKLRGVTNKFIKSKLRGDFETSHFVNYELFKSELKRLKHDMGVYDKMETYLICDPIDAIAEIGYDGYSISGMYPERSCSGIEVKDCGYIGKMVEYKFLPKQIKDATDAFSPIFQGYGFNGAFSTEMRVDEKKDAYFIDPTMRFPEPNTALTLLMYDNYSEIIWDVAHGVVPNIQSKYLWGVEFIIKSEMAKTEPVAIQFPEEYKDHIKLKNMVVDQNGTWYFTPNNIEMCEIGAVVACGNTMEEAVKMATEIAKTVEGHDIKINTDCLEDAQRQMQELKKNGISFI